MKDQISALVDGELDDAEAARLVARLGADPELRRAWDEYHRVGDTLRGHFSRDLTAAVRARLADEPTVLAPRPRSERARSAGRWAVPAVAGAAAVALVAWMAIPARSPAPQVAQSPAAVVAQGAAPAATAPQPRAPAVPVPTGQAGQPQAGAQLAGVGNYLLAHQRFSPANAMQGVAPYVRTVSSGGGDR